MKLDEGEIDRSFVVLRSCIRNKVEKAMERKGERATDLLAILNDQQSFLRSKLNQNRDRKTFEYRGQDQDPCY